MQAEAPAYQRFNLVEVGNGSEQAVISEQLVNNFFSLEE